MRAHCAVIAGLAGLIASGVATADEVEIFSGKAIDHPDGNANPPGYGLRLDKLFTFDPDSGAVEEDAASGGITTFSFSHELSNVQVKVSDTDDDGAGDKIRVFGTVYGGEDTGGGYGFGEGLYEMKFTWTQNVIETEGDDGGWQVTPASTLNGGFIRALDGIDGVEEGTSWDLFGQEDANKNTFKLQRDGHRLGGYPDLASLDPFVGRGWVTLLEDGTKNGATQDFLFVVVPTPAALPMGLAGLAGLGGVAWIRRRK